MEANVAQRHAVALAQEEVRTDMQHRSICDTGQGRAPEDRRHQPPSSPSNGKLTSRPADAGVGERTGMTMEAGHH
jgi:hypothetical protein